MRRRSSRISSKRWSNEADGGTDSHGATEKRRRTKDNADEARLRRAEWIEVMPKIQAGDGYMDGLYLGISSIHRRCLAIAPAYATPFVSVALFLRVKPFPPYPPIALRQHADDVRPRDDESLLGFEIADQHRRILRR